MTQQPQRIGGLAGSQLDPSIVEWGDQAARNLAARTKKQKRDAERVRVRVDVHLWLKEALAAVAKTEDTSTSQLASFLLAWGLYMYATTPELRQAITDAKRVSRTPKTLWNLEIPEEIANHFG